MTPASSNSDGSALAVRAAEAEVRAGCAEAQAAALQEELGRLQGEGLWQMTAADAYRVLCRQASY